MLPSCPGDTGPLLGTDDPATAATRCREPGAAAVAVTCGEDGVLADLGDGATHLPPMLARSVVDTTGGYLALFDRLGAVAVLWRPDGYLFGYAESADDIEGLVHSYPSQVLDFRAAEHTVTRSAVR